MLSLLATLLLAVPQAKDRPAVPPPSVDRNRPQPQGHKPYLHPKPKPDLRYHTQHGHRFKHGHYYHGHHHPHWSYHYWDRRYGAYLYYDPGVRVYYYWCAPHFRYYPVSYLPAGCRYDYDYDPEPKPPKSPPPAPPPPDKE